MSLDVYLEAARPTVVFECNITHNLARMARAAGVYEALWRPEEIEAVHAGDLIPSLTRSLKILRTQDLSEHEPANGWGRQSDLRRFVIKYLIACRRNPDAKISVWR